VFIGIEMSALNKEFLANTFHDLFTNSQKYSSRNHSIESDVQREKERINRNDLSVLVPNEPLIVKQLLKLFRKSKVQVAAVDNLNLGVKNHSCFGLLVSEGGKQSFYYSFRKSQHLVFKGMNGAGKTTTFRMITGDIDPNRGDVIINGYSIQANKYLARKHLGYCPQFDCLPFYLTVRETIQLFAELRGIDKTISKRLTDDMLFIFQLKEFRNTLVQNLRFLFALKILEMFSHLT
jgi:ATP-binding cassette subfamily A (ABC1) protein 3